MGAPQWSGDVSGGPGWGQAVSHWRGIACLRCHSSGKLVSDNLEDFVNISAKYYHQFLKSDTRLVGVSSLNPPIDRSRVVVGEGRDSSDSDL